MSNLLLAVAVMTAVTYFTRALPFLFFAKRNVLLSIVGGTALYMALIRML
jgi:branched-subunit amino acid transport protein AzlD